MGLERLWPQVFQVLPAPALLCSGRSDAVGKVDVPFASESWQTSFQLDQLTPPHRIPVLS